MKLHEEYKRYIKSFEAKKKLCSTNPALKLYDYSKVICKNPLSKVIISCPEHGEFKEALGSLCPVCLFNLEFEDKYSNLVKENSCLDFSKVDYKDNKQTTVTVTCSKHSDFEHTPWKRDRWEFVCGFKTGIATVECPTCKREEFTKEFVEVHGNKYDYSKINYNFMYKITIICPEHGQFRQTPSSHKRGSGCPKCAKYGFDILKPGILYYLRISGGLAYKIGITNNTVKNRFSAEEYKRIEIIRIIEYSKGIHAYNEEQKILKKYRYAKYQGEKLLDTGNTELFDYDILELDKSLKKTYKAKKYIRPKPKKVLSDKKETEEIDTNKIQKEERDKIINELLGSNKTRKK